MEEAIAGFQAAPLWAQIGMGLFALLFVVMVVEPPLRHRKFRRQFEALAQGLGGKVKTGSGGWPLTFPFAVDGRTFEVRHDLRTGRSGSYRGPRGYLFMTSTRLAGDRWTMHQVDIAPLEGGLSWLVRNHQRTGDPDFDARFLVTEEGLAVRDGWLDGPLRQEIARFFEAAPTLGLLWLHEGELLFTMSDPGKGVDAETLRALLQRQAILASELERTARPRI